MMYGPGMIGTTPVFIDTGWSRAACGNAGHSLKWFSIIAIPSQNWHGALLVPRWWVASIISWLDSTQFVCTLLHCNIFLQVSAVITEVIQYYLVVPCPMWLLDGDSIMVFRWKQSRMNPLASWLISTAIIRQVISPLLKFQSSFFRLSSDSIIFINREQFRDIL